MSHKSSLSKRTGTYGKRKYQVFTVLFVLGYKYGRDNYLSTRELAIYSGIPYRSLTRVLPKWVEWEYVERRPAQSFRKHIGDYEYRLMPHGKSWLDLAKNKLHTRIDFHRELSAWFQFATRNKEFLFTCKFDKLLQLLDVVKTKIPRVAWHTVKLEYDKETKQYNVSYDDSLAS